MPTINVETEKYCIFPECSKLFKFCKKKIVINSVENAHVIKIYFSF